MGLTNAFGLLALIGVPIIIILYMLRPKNKPQVIPSLYLWQKMEDDIQSASRIKKLKSSILMFIQILAVIIVALILAGLYITSTDYTDNILLIIEASYSMKSEDVGENRMEYAKEVAGDYLNNLSQDASVTLVVLEDVPKTILRGESDKAYIISLIDQIQSVDGLSDSGLVAETIEALREPNQEVVYIGDRYFKGVSNMRTIRDGKNYSVHDISYTKYFKEGTITALTEIFNHDQSEALIPISLYVDGEFFGAKQIEIEGGSSGKVFFDSIPYNTKELMVQIDGEDILSVDNRAYTIVSGEKKQEALLVTSGNNFLEKALSLHPSVELFVTDSPEGLFGYDLYVFDGVFPEALPVDGSYILFNPEERYELPQLGYVENPVFTTGDHPVTNHIEKTEFATRYTSVYDVSDGADVFYNTPYGAGGFETLRNDNRCMVFGFDLHDTDLPLSIEFPVMMMNTLEYMLYSKMAASDSIAVSESNVINVYPSTVEGSVTTPSGMELPIDINRREFVFSGTGEAGIYRVTQVRQYDTLTEEFAVNIPKVVNSDEEINEKDLIDAPLSTRSLSLYLSMALLVLVGLEWFVYSYRRKIHEYKL